MLKGYIAKWKKREGAEPIMDYWFTSGIENAAHWRTKEDAKMDCVLFHNLPITIQSSQGGFYTIKDFKVEERALGEFVICCEAPFIMTGKGEAKVPEARKGYIGMLSKVLTQLPLNCSSTRSMPLTTQTGVQ